MGSQDQQVVPGQAWRRLSVPELGGWEPRLRVSVVLPARDCQQELDRTLAALAQQSYPDSLLEVVVVDDASAAPLRLPERRPAKTKLVRLEDAQSHGSGRARHTGTEHTDADVLLFLDADMVAQRTHVEAHARWHHHTPHALVLGCKWFVDFAGITPEDVGRAAEQGDVASCLGDRRRRGHVWQEDFISSQQDLSVDSDDAFIAVVGATVSLRADFYTETGGFSSFGLRGIVDTEFGYRAYTSGALLVPDGEAVAYHQGARNFSSRGDEIKRQRTGLAANYLPIPLFRLAAVGRQWAVPRLSVVVDTEGAAPEEVQFTVDSVLASDITDLTVTLVGGGEPLPQWLLDYVSHDGRVKVSDRPLASGFPSPLSVAVSAGLVLEVDTLSRCLSVLAEHRVGVVRTRPDDLGGRGIEVWRTRALRRVNSGSGGQVPAGLSDRVAELFGERWVEAAAFGVHTGQLRITKQGMLVGEPGPAPG